MPEVIEAASAPVEAPVKTEPSPGKTDGSSLAAKWLSRRADEKSVVKPDATEAKKTEDTKTEAKPAAKSKASKPAPIPTSPTTDYREMGAEIAAGIREGIKPLVAQPKTDKANPAEKLSYSERRELEVIQQLEKDNPHYKGRAEKYLDSIKKEEAYALDWMQKNPDRDYDPNDDEHKAFQKLHGLDDIDADDFEAAREIVLRREITREVRKELEPEFEKRLAPIEQGSRLEAERSQIIKSRVTAAQTFFAKLGDGFSKVIRPDGGFDLAEGDKLVAENPANNIPLNASLRVQFFAEQIHRLAREKPLPPLERPANPNLPYVSPQEAEAIATSIENDLSVLPANVSLEDGGSLDERGRRFATYSEWQTLTPEQKQRHWRLDNTNLPLQYAADQAAKARAEMPQWEQEMEAYAKAKGYVKNGQPAKIEAQETTTKITPSPAAPIAPNSAQRMTKDGVDKQSENSGWLSKWTSRK